MAIKNLWTCLALAALGIAWSGCAAGGGEIVGGDRSHDTDASSARDMLDPVDPSWDLPTDPGRDTPADQSADLAPDSDLPDDLGLDPDGDMGLDPGVDQQIDGEDAQDAEEEPPDRDGDGVPDEWDEFPDDRDEWNDNDDDGIGDNADTDDDNDGISDEEETSYGEDCMISDPYHEDGDSDGIPDSEDPYPRDPFPEFVVNANDEGSIYFFLSNRDGTFGDRQEWGEDIGDNYRVFAIADFDDNGKMDFIAHSATEDGGQYDMFFFYRTYKEDEFTQTLVGTTDLRAGGGIVADVDGDHLFDIVVPVIDKPEYIASVTGYTFLNNGTILSAPCAVADYPDTNCAFTRRPCFYLGTGSVVDGQWGFTMAHQAVDITGDGHKDVVIAIFPHGGICDSTIYVLEGAGDGTFSSTPRQVLVHDLSAVISLVFADFDTDEIGDVIMGMDDDGDAGQAWLYRGNGEGSFHPNPTPALDLEPGIESGADNIGVSSTARTFDFDFDGGMDIMVSHNVGASPYLDGPSIIELYRGHGDGTFYSPTLVGTQVPTALGNTFEIPQRLCPWYELTE